MSRIGKAPIALPKGVEVSVSKNNLVTVKGPKGSLKQQIDPDLTIEIEGETLTVQRPTDQKRHKTVHGLYRSLINNMITGVSTGFKADIELVGVGYRAANTGRLLELTLGFSHPILFMLPDEINLETKQDKGGNPTIIMECIDKQLLGQVSAKIRSFRKPEPYKGKGVRFVGEVVRRKLGKTGAKKK
ncbi:MAG: 50S ribosomal protein L6 [Bacteroidetes bacterium]|jgi:large subunit ribosomal protein L6|nr:50S ribosomal protein L6 [Bacteroidota bacterium]